MVWSGLLSTAFFAAAAPLHLDMLKVGSKVYSNVTILGANTTDLYFTHSTGIGNVKLRLVDENLRKRFHFDPQVAAEAERQQTADDTAYVNNLASNAVARAQKALRAAKKAASTSETSLADPIADKSLLGKPAPTIQAEKWLGDKPIFKDKFVLVAFWAPWSIPCRKIIPEWNALQKKFAEKLTVVGITSDSAEEVAEMAEPKIEFPIGIDTKAHLSALAGVTSVPHVLLLDPKGIVLFDGHPLVLDEKKLQVFLTPPGP